MAQADEIAGWLREMHLADGETAIGITELTGGVSGEIYRVDLPAGPICLKRSLSRLKVADTWLASPARIEAEKRWLRLVGTIAPASVPNIIGEVADAFVFAMPYLDPRDYRNWKILLSAGTIRTEDASAVGALLGRVHTYTAGDAVVAKAFANDRDFADLRLKPYLLATARRHPDVAAELERLSARTASTKEALVHGDYSPKNILIGPHGPVVLDAECAWFGDPAFDTAFCLNHLALKCVWKPAWKQRYLAAAKAFWQSYIDEAPPGDAAAIGSRTATLLPALMLARIDGSSPVEYLVEPHDKDAVRGFSKRMLTSPVHAVDDFLTLWNEELPA